MEKFKINKQKCTGCQVCVQVCPGATKIGRDSKAEIINQEKLEQCGGETVCPMGAIEKIAKEEKAEIESPSQPAFPNSSSYQSPSFSGRGSGRGMSRGLGKGSRNGRGRGRGGGGKRI